MSELAQLGYLVAAGLFILGIKGLGHPRTAVRGNLFGSLGMLLAIVVTLIDTDVVNWTVIIAGLAVGGLIGVILAARVEMTAMPQLVALFNGFGGAASVLVAGASYVEEIGNNPDPSVQFVVAAAATAIIGAVTFTGSLIAFGKLQEILTGNSISFPGLQALNLLLLAGAVALGAALVMNPGHAPWLWIIVGLSALLGILVVIPVGGADMPVVIALLNSYSGLAAAATGFVLDNSLLIIAGSLVGASGLILTNIMCVAMNRSLLNVLLGKGQAQGVVASADEVYAGKIKATSADEVAMLLETARRVVMVPGYGMAVAQAQHAVRDLTNALEKKGIEVEFAIHPVAGRMPGHMNVLLAEAEISYDKLKEMDVINPSFAQTDVAIVIGANDVVNPLARTDPESPIAGMPILDVDKANTVIMIKRSLSPGFAGIPNPLFAADNCLMFFGDGKKAIVDLTAAVNEA